jgi:GT2 family glycosyltransferase
MNSPITNDKKHLITVFILNWNRRDDTIEAIKSVQEQTYKPIQILVVDNGSTDGSPEAIEQAFPEATSVRLDQNYGCPGGRNRGIPHAKGEFIFFLDNDGLLEPDAVEQAHNAISKDSRIAVISGKTVFYKTGETHFLFGDNSAADRSFFTAEFSGGASMHRAVIYEEIGLYPDDYMYGGEETNLAMRLIDHGWLIQYVPSVVMHHKVLSSARDRRREFVGICSNVQATYWSLYPLELAILHTIRELILQPIRATKRKAFWLWIKATPKRIARVTRAIFRDRSPLARSTFPRIQRLRSNAIEQADQAAAIQGSYARYLLRLLTGRKG